MKRAILTGLVLVCGAFGLARRALPRVESNPHTTSTVRVLRVTNRPFDIAIQGRGYLRVLVPAAETGAFTAFTRSAALMVDADGTLVLARMVGAAIEPRMVIPDNASSVIIVPEGGVYVTLPGESEYQMVGQFELAAFENPLGLAAMGSDLFVETPDCGNLTLSEPGTVNFGHLRQGMLECDATSSLAPDGSTSKRLDLRATNMVPRILAER